MRNILLITILTILGFSTTISAQNEWLEKGNTQYELMEFDAAIQSYLEHVKRNPSDKYALINLAKSYNYIGDWDNAAKSYYEALGYSISSEYLLEHGLIQMKLGRYEAAKEQFMIYANVNKAVGSNYAKMCDFAYSKKNMPSLFEVSKLPINTTNSEFSPAFLGNDLVFVSGRKDIMRTDATNGAVSGNDPKYNFLFKTEAAGVKQPEYVRSWFRDNNLVNEGPISYSNDGQWVAFVENTYKEGVSKMAHDLFKGDIFIAKIAANGDWEEAVPFPFNGEFSNNFPQLSEDGNMLYFSSDKAGGQGGYDIYVSKRENGTWLSPRNVGAGINQAGNEISPFIDGEDFYFSSDYLTGFGGQDVFKANLKNGKWSISNMGTGVNTSANDYGYIYDMMKNSGYMVSDREGVENIYKVVKTSDDVKILVLDAATRVPIPSVSLDFKNCGKGVYKTNQQGKLGFKATAGADCFIDVYKIGYERRKVDIGPKSNNNGIVEVLLYKKGEMYQGKIVDGIRDENLANVRVKVINQGNGQKNEVYSDQEGIYTLALQPYSTYMIQFDKMGYVGIGDKIETDDGSDKGVLGSQLLFPTSNETGVTNIPSVPNPITEPVPDPVVSVPVPTPTVPTPDPSPVVTPSPIVTTPTPSPPVVTPSPTVPTPPVVTTPKPTPDPVVSTPSIGTSVSGYSVQLLSLSKGNKNFPEKIKDLKGMVTRVYVKTDEKWRRFRVGTYTARIDAESVLNYIKAMGFESAYIVEEDAKGSIEEVNL